MTPERVSPTFWWPNSASEPPIHGWKVPLSPSEAVSLQTRIFAPATPSRPVFFRNGRITTTTCWASIDQQTTTTRIGTRADVFVRRSRPLGERLCRRRRARRQRLAIRTAFGHEITCQSNQNKDFALLRGTQDRCGSLTSSTMFLLRWKTGNFMR